MRWRSISLMFLVALAQAPDAATDDALSWSGFATLRGTTGAEDDGPLRQNLLVGRLQLGLDWTSTSVLSAHVHLLARTDVDGSQKGAAGVPEAYLEANFHSERARLRLRGGAFFLPTSFENIDALWENPYTISSSALNSWMGEEVRPVGIDAAYYRSGVMVGATLYRGNDTLGALPPVRGWQLHDRWTLLGEKVPVNERVFTSVSAENDGRLGWSARAGWAGRHLALQYTHLDNRSDGLLYGDLFNWNTRFDMVGLGYNRGRWTVASETGWGPTFLVVRGRAIVSDIRASYLLISRRFGIHRASVRVDGWDDGESSDEAVTLSYSVSAARQLTAGVELVATGRDTRLMVQARYGFSFR